MGHGLGCWHRIRAARLSPAGHQSGAEQDAVGVSDRGASVRIRWHVARDGCVEDHRPNANAAPYQVPTLLTLTVCEALASCV